MILYAILIIVILFLLVSVWRLRVQQKKLIKVVGELHSLGKKLLDATSSANKGGLYLSNTVEALLRDFEEFQMNVVEFMSLTAEFMSYIRPKKVTAFFLKKPEEEKLN